MIAYAKPYWGLVAAILAAGWMLLSGPAPAQTAADYGTVTDGDGAMPPEQLRLGDGEAATAPRQSRPGDGTPSAADYGRVAETVTDEPMLSQTRKAVTLFRERLRSMVRRIPDAWEKIEAALAAASPTGQPSYFIGVALFAALLLMIGRTFAIVFMVYVARRILVSMQQTERHGYLGKLPLLAFRMFMTAIGVAVSVGIAALIGLFFYQEHEATLLTVVVVFGTYAMINLVDTTWRMAIAPFLSEYRLPTIPDDAARDLYAWLSAVSIFGILAMAFAYWMQVLGLAAEIHTLLIVVLSLIILILALVIMYRHRKTISGAILAGRARDEASWLTLGAVALWGPIATLYLVFTWGDLSFRMIMGIESSPLRLAVPYGIFLAGLIVYALASYLIERIFSRARQVQAINAELDAQREAEEAAEAARMRELASGGAADIDGDGDEGAPAQPIEQVGPRPARRRHSMQTMEDLARRTASLFAIGAVAYALVRFWGGAGVFERIPGLTIAEDLIDTLLIGYVLYHAVRIWIDGKIAEEVGDEEDQGPDGRRRWRRGRDPARDPAALVPELPIDLDRGRDRALDRGRAGCERRTALRRCRYRRSGHRLRIAGAGARYPVGGLLPVGRCVPQGRIYRCRQRQGHGREDQPAARFSCATTSVCCTPSRSARSSS